MTPAEDEAPVLVVLINNRLDWQRVVTEHWYRIPLKHAPQPAAASFLAFYQSRAFGADAFHIRFFAPVERYRVMTRREILPHEPEHPRAAERYYRVELGSMRELEPPIPSRRLRRITFIPTTLRRLQEAREINDLWLGDGAEELLWTLFRDAGIKAERRLMIGEGRERYLATLAIPFSAPGREGGLAIFCDTRLDPRHVGAWRCLHLRPDHVYASPVDCFERVRVTLTSLEQGADT